MRTLVIFFILVSSCYAATGMSKLCDDIGYLSTSCKNVEMLDPKYKDKDVALKDAGSSKSYSNSINNSKTYVSNTTDKDGITVKTWFEEE